MAGVGAADPPPREPLMGSSGVPEPVVRAWVEASCRAQGFPVAVTDAVTVATVVALLTGEPPPRGRAAARSDTPDRFKPVDVEDAASGLVVRVDENVFEDGTDDRALAGDVEVVPLGA